MLKTILFTILFLIPLSATQQVILVISDDFNASQGRLYTYEKNAQGYKEVFEPFSVNLGRNGLAWGINQDTFVHAKYDPQKYEGDGKSPAGIFTIKKSFGYATTNSGQLPYLHASDNLICIDDATASEYNTIQLENNPKEKYKSFEWMKREDDLYRLGLVVNYNQEGIKNRGSCIFLHVQKSENAPTAGCTAMPIEALAKIINWLQDEPEPLLIQIPRHYCNALPEPFSDLPCE